MSDTPRSLPSCCGSEDGDLIYGVDPGVAQVEAMTEAWKCNTCGTLTITSLIIIEGATQ